MSKCVQTSPPYLSLRLVSALPKGPNKSVIAIMFYIYFNYQFK